QGGSDYEMKRIEIRRDYTRNYFLPSVIYRSAAEIIRGLTSQGIRDNYPHFLARAMVVGFAIVFAVTTIALFACVVALREFRILVALMLAITLMAGIEWAGGFYGSYVMFNRTIGLEHLVLAAKIFIHEAVGLVVNPTVAFSPFGDTPRSHFILLTLAVFACRLKSYYGGSYALVWL